MKKTDISQIRDQYESSNRKKYLILATSVAVMAVLGLYFVTIGIADTSFVQVIEAVAAWAGGRLGKGENAAAYKIIVLMRLPRIVIAAIAGIGLAVSGVTMQAVTRNPLVSPFTMGISSASAFGASLCIVFGTGMFLKSEIGIICCAFLSAAVVQWTFGTFNGTVWRDVLFSGLFVLVCSYLIMVNYLKLNAMASGEDELVKSLGVDPERVRAVMCLASVFMTAAVISFTGVIGFVGLVAPHIARLLVGNDHRFLIPFSAVTGSMLLMISDAIGKTILSPVSIPVGIVVSFLGVPLFINLILKGRRRNVS